MLLVGCSAGRQSDAPPLATMPVEALDEMQAATYRSAMSADVDRYLQLLRAEDFDPAKSVLNRTGCQTWQIDDRLRSDWLLANFSEGWTFTFVDANRNNGSLRVYFEFRELDISLQIDLSLDNQGEEDWRIGLGC